VELPIFTASPFLIAILSPSTNTASKSNTSLRSFSFHSNSPVNLLSHRAYVWLNDCRYA
jgi:hypothetical protein